MPNPLERRLEQLERSKKRGGMVVLREGDPEPKPKRGQVVIRVCRSYMQTDGKLLTPEQIAAYHVRCAEIVIEEAARVEEEQKRQQERDSEAQAAAAAKARLADAAPSTLAPSHTVDGGLPTTPVAYTEEQLAARGWQMTPAGLVMRLTR